MNAALEAEAAEKLKRRWRRLDKWFNSLTPEQQKPPSKKVIAAMRAQGLIDDNGLTGAGRLKLHQLELLEEWVKIKKRRRKKAFGKLLDKEPFNE